MKYDAIILAAGSGRRMNSRGNKIFLKLEGKFIFEYSLDLFKADEDCHRIFLVGKASEREMFESYLGDEVYFVEGGKERQDSVRNALDLVSSSHVMIHDGARPFVDEAGLSTLKACPNSILAVPVKDTIKMVSEATGFIEETPARERLYAAQTPQFFESKEIRRVHIKAHEVGFLGTDDASLLEKFSDYGVRIVEGSYSNIKITTPDDLFMAELILRRREQISEI
ncbi:2-C-methyl-D-erythritol 4-phosphate cytidylyltransferase [Streptococcaceae bacterium ESL0687]|nr:2-C-methyl-D-erythritol 4-phosphate cytidylyltransferase [Streptococcaceae bacterium ESL0687]